MRTGITISVWTAVLVLAGLAPAARSEVTGMRGATTVKVVQTRTGQPDSTDALTQTYPETSSVLPLQSVVKLVVTEEPPAAGAVAAQFADPATSLSSDPDEFAITLALSSVAADVRYSGYGSSEELRSVRYTAAELNATPGERVTVIGRVFLDGAMTIFAGSDARDLTGASVVLRVTVTKEVSGAQPETVFTGSLDVEGGTDRSVTARAGGKFPTSAVLSTDLAGIDPSLGVFRVYAFAPFSIDYTYDAVVDEAFDLRAKVEVEAANVAGGVGVAALIGTPLDALAQVITQTQGQTTGAKMLTALEKERTDPSGTPAFPRERAATLFPACGLFGLEGLLLVAGLIGLRRVRW